MPELPGAAVLAAARELCKIHAGQCGVDYDDTWAIYSEQFKSDARACLEAAAPALATLQAQAQPAAVSDATINRVVYEHTKLNPNQADDLDLLLGFRNAVRAILALRPQAVPMTDTERADMICAVAAICTGTSSRNLAATAIEWTERRYCITAHGTQGGEG